MARYFFHLCDGIDVLLDPDGISLDGADAITRQALIEARSIMSHEVKSGRLELGQRIDVVDGAGDLVHSLQFADALEIVTSKQS